ncbi:MAG: hypothetical protein ACT4OG_07420 [Alphaproteobacteria bacterium]
MADITYSTSEDMTEVIFSANNEKAEAWLGAREHRVSTEEAEVFKRHAEEAGFTVVAFP